MNWAQDLMLQRHEPTPEVPAPGFTLEDLDRLLKAHYERGYQQGRQEGITYGHARGSEAGERLAYDALKAQVQRIVGGQLIHIARRLDDRKVNPPKKTTIADERHVAFEQGQQLWKAVRDLEALALRQEET